MSPCKRLIFRRVVEPLLIHRFGRMSALPRNGFSHRLVKRHLFRRTELISYPAGVSAKVMFEVVGSDEMLGHRLLTERYYFSAPICRAPDACDPPGFCKRVGFSDVVDPTRCAVVNHRERDRAGDVLNISASPSPSRVFLFQQNRPPAICHSF